MCGACGVLQGGPEWLDCAGFGGPRLAERHKRLRLVNRMLADSGTRVSDSGGRFVLRSLTGATRVVDDLAHLWLAAARIGGRPVDPLAGAARGSTFLAKTGNDDRRTEEGTRLSSEGPPIGRHLLGASPRFGAVRARVSQSVPTASRPPDKRIPVIVLSGFLGSGKTTLLKALLADSRGPRTAVIINEFGEISLDHLLVREVSESRIVLKSGCVCCIIRTDLQSALRELVDSRAADQPFERIVIETTGLADPGPIAHTIGTDPMLRRQVRLAGIVSTVDAVHGAHQLEAHPECMQQVAIADQLIVTKTDLAPPATVGALMSRLRKLNADAPVLQRTVVAGDLEPIIARLTRAENSTAWISCSPAVVRHGGIESIHVETERPIDWTAFAVWLSAFVHGYADGVLRIKGLIDVPGLPAPLVLHVVRNHIHPPDHLDSWPDDSRSSRIVFIVKDIDTQTIRRSLLDFLGDDHLATTTLAALAPEDLQPA